MRQKKILRYVVIPFDRWVPLLDHGPEEFFERMKSLAHEMGFDFSRRENERFMCRIEPNGDWVHWVER